MIRLIAAIAVALLLQEDEPEDSPNLQPPPDIPAAAVAADEKGWELLKEFRKDGKDRSLLTKSIEQFRTADRLAGKPFPLVWYHMGIAYQNAEDYKEAKRRLERCVEVNPKFHEAFLELGDVYVWLKSFEMAAKTYDKAIALKSDYADAHRNKAVALMRRSDFVGAQKAVDRALEIKPEDDVAKSLKKIADREVEGSKMAREYVKETDHFAITTNIDQKFTDWIARHAELVFKKYNSIFPPISKGKDKFRILIFGTQEEYYEYGGPRGSGGYYQDLTKRLVFYNQETESDTLLVLYHEAFHQFLAYYLDHAPQWFGEGHADYFGPSLYNERTKAMDIRLNPWRLELIQRAIGAGQYHPFSRIMQMSRAEMYDPRTISINYAQAWSMIYFFWHYQKGKYGPLLQAYFKQLMKDEDLKAAYEAVWAKQDLKKIEEEWAQFIWDLESK